MTGGLQEQQQEKRMTLADLRVLSDLSRYNCSRFGPFTSIIYEDGQEVRTLTNMDIAKEAAQLADGLQKLGVEKGDRVIVMMLNCPEVLIAYQAISRAGGVIIPVMPLLKAPEVRYIAQNSAAKVIITSPILVPSLQGALADIPTMRHMIVTGDPDMLKANFFAQDGAEDAENANGPRMHAYADIAVEGKAAADHFLEPGNVDVSPDDMAVILYTSGTTGNPKGVVLSHRSLITNATGIVGAERDVAEQEVNLAVLPLAHAYGILAANVFFLRGLTIVAHPRFDTTAVLKAIEQYHIVSFAGVPAMFVALLYSPEANKYDTSSLVTCSSGSAPLPVAILEAFEQKFGCTIYEGYGLSEASAALTATGANGVRKPGSVGVPLPGVELLIVDDNDQPVPTGEIGEVIARGPNIMQSYYNMPEETKNALRNGWLHTGDMGRLDEDGFLYIVERKKDLIIRGGFNIYPRDVEEVLNSHPAVIESAVVGIPSERMGEEIKAYVVTRESVSADELMAYCRQSLANYKTPGEIEFIVALPRNPVGKIDKKELRKQHVH